LTDIHTELAIAQYFIVHERRMIIMARLLNLPGKGNPALKGIDNRVELIVNRNLSREQQNAGVIAKVQVRHPAVSFVVTVWGKDGRKWLTTPSQQGTKSWFPLITLKDEVRDYILNYADSNEEDNSAWYLDAIGEHTINITDGPTNPDLGIEAIIVDGNLTYRQQGKGMICKVNIVTTIGTIIGYNVWNSKFGRSLYASAPNEGAMSDDNRQRNNPGYRVSREATAQVLALLHKQVDFDAQVEIPESSLSDAVKKAAEQSDKEIEAAGFEKVGDSMFEAGSDESK
jgi:hypothetical protein